MSKKKEIEIVKDFGNITVPTSWDEITLRQFTSLVRMQDEKEGDQPSVVDLMAALTNTDRKFIYSLPSDFAETIMGHLIFLNTPLDENPKSEVEINGETYKINYMEKLKFGEYTDANSVMQNDKFDYASLLAILCRREGEKYDDDFIADKLDIRTEMWNNQPITKVYPLIAFFLTLSVTSGTRLEQYLTTTEDQLLQLVKDIKSSVKCGGGTKLPMTSRMKVWWKCRKLEKCISQQRSNTSAT